MTYVLSFSLFVDLIWLISWAVSYNEFLTGGQISPLFWMSGVIHFTMTISILEFLLKVININKINKIAILTYILIKKEEIRE
jgi:hypothetical protein